MTPVVTPSELLEMVAGGLDDTGLDLLSSAPAVVLDLDSEVNNAEVKRLSALLEGAPVVLIGMSENGARDNESILGLDVLMCSSAGGATPWVECGAQLHEMVEQLCTSISASPDASVAFAQLLSVGEFSSPAEAVIAESWVYSLLQGGATYSEWLHRRSERTRKPRPDHSVVRVDRNGDVLTVTLNRPEVHNAYGTRMRDELVEAFRLVDIDRTISRVILCGEGPSFCSGGDLDEFGTAPAPVEAHGIRTRRNAGIALAAIAERVEVYVHGTCVGAGVELPAFANRVVAHSATSFLLPEISMGLVPGAGGTSSIPRRIGRHRAAYFGLSGRPIDSQTALAWGLIDEIADDGPLRGDTQ